MRQLIAISCREENLYHPVYYMIQRAILKNYFDAADITIDFDMKTISILSGEDTVNSHSKSHPTKEVAALNISFTNLEDTLQGCLESGEVPLQFYDAMVRQYTAFAMLPEQPISA